MKETDIDELISKVKINDEYDLDAQWQACIKLGRLKDAKTNQKIIDVLIEALESKSDLTRAYAAEALGNLEIKESAEKLKRLLNDPFPNARAQSVTALGKLKEESAISLIIECLSYEKNYRVREDAYEALHKICFESGSQKCKEALEVLAEERMKIDRERESRHLRLLKF
jgi:HEAT repeat protein